MIYRYAQGERRRDTRKDRQRDRQRDTQNLRCSQPLLTSSPSPAAPPPLAPITELRERWLLAPGKAREAACETAGHGMHPWTMVTIYIIYSV